MTKPILTNGLFIGPELRLRHLECENGDDITANLQAAVDYVTAQGGGTIIVPPGVYDISSTILVLSVAGVNIHGVGIKTTAFNWVGPAGIPAFKFDGTQNCSLADFRFQIQSGFTCDTFLEVGQDNGTLSSTQHRCQRLQILGAERLGIGLYYKLYAADLKNDFHTAYHTQIQAYTDTGIIIEGYNAKKLRFEAMRVQARNSGNVGVDTTRVPGAGGSFSWFDGQNSENNEWDWKLGKPNDPIVIYGAYSQASARFLYVDNDYSGIQPTEFNCITFSGCKFSSRDANLPVDNIIVDIRGSGPVNFVDGCKLGGNAGTLILKYRYLPQRISGFATADLIITGGAISDGETVTLGVQTYTWRTALVAGGLPYEVVIGSTIQNSVFNLTYAINLNDPDVNEGVVYGLGTLVNSEASASRFDTDTLRAEALAAGVAGNTVVTLETMAFGSWLYSGAPTVTLQGGSGSGGYENVRGNFAVENSVFSSANRVGITDFFTELPPDSLKGTFHYNVQREFKPMVFGDGYPFDAEFFVPKRDPDWNNRGLPCARVWHLMNRSNGNGLGLVLDMQRNYPVLDLHPYAMALAQYNQVVAPFTAGKTPPAASCISFDNTASQALSLDDDDNLLDTSTTSLAMGMYGVFGTPGTNAHLLVVGSGATGAGTGPFVRQRTDGRLSILCDGNTVTGTYNYDDGDPHVVLCILDWVLGRLLVVTDMEIIDYTATNAFPVALPSIGGKGLGSSAPAAFGPTCDARMFFCFYGEDVQRLQVNGIPGAWAPGDIIPLLLASAIVATGPNPQSFSYTVTGAEPDLTELVIPLPTTRADASYRVFWAQATATNLLAGAVATVSKTTTQFVLSLSGAATALDVLDFYVVQA